MNADAGLNVKRASEAVTSGGAACGYAGGAASGILVTVFVQPFSDVGDSLDEGGGP